LVRADWIPDLIQRYGLNSPLYPPPGSGVITVS
jgi:hypothetical protein